MLLNLAGVANTEDKDVLWQYLRRYVPGATPENAPYLDRLLAGIRKQKRTIAENGDPDTQVQKLEDMNARLNRTLAVYLANTRDLRRKVSASRE